MNVATWFAVFALTAGLSLLCGGAQAQELWNGISLGDTQREVLKRLPSARNTPAPAKQTSFGELLITLPGVDVFGHPGRADFYFEKNRLTTVRLVVQPQDLTQRSNRRVLERMEAELGPPSQCLLSLCSWRLPTRTVGFGAGDIQRASELMVEYTATRAARGL